MKYFLKIFSLKEKIKQFDLLIKICGIIFILFFNAWILRNSFNIKNDNDVIFAILSLFIELFILYLLLSLIKLFKKG